MTNKTKWIIGVIVFVLVVVGISASTDGNNQTANDQPIKIGIVTALSGNLSYWGESTRAGAQLAVKELNNNGIKTNVIFEDGGTKSKSGLNAAKKLLNKDKVNALYTEFTGPSTAIASLMKGKSTLQIYSATSLSPLDASKNVFKTFYDYRTACAEMSRVLQGRGVKRVGILKPEAEFGDLCLSGIKSVYSEENAFSESYNLGKNDFRTQLTSLKSNNVGAIFNNAYEEQLLTTLRQKEELGMDAVYAGPLDLITGEIQSKYADQLEGAVLYGYKDVPNGFRKKLDESSGAGSVEDYNVASLAYIHTKQLAKAISGCEGDIQCSRQNLQSAPPGDLLEFQEFDQNRIANFETIVKVFRDGELLKAESAPQNQ